MEPCVVRIHETDINEETVRDTLHANCSQIRDTLLSYHEGGIPANVSIKSLVAHAALKPVYDLVIKSLNLLDVNPSTAVTIGRKLGKGAEGYVFSANININTISVPFVIKRSTYPGKIGDINNVNKKIASENILSEKLNELRDEIPNFVLTFGSFICPASKFSDLGIAEDEDFAPAIRDPVNALCKPNGDIKHIYTVIEPITGISPASFIDQLLINDEVATMNAICIVQFDDADLFVSSSGR